MRPGGPSRTVIRANHVRHRELNMNAVVVYESVYGNTRAIAEAIGEGIGGATVVPVSEAGDPAGADLLVVGGPTHMHGLASKHSREIAAEAGKEDKAIPIDAHATAEPGLRTWLHELSESDGARAAAFDTRLDKSPWLTGLASRGIAKRLRGRGYDVSASESFLVEDTEGPLADGELDRARAWGRQLADGSPAQSSTRSSNAPGS
jgi:flavodoxin-like protein